MKMPFGQYTGMELADVPRPYLQWLHRQPWLRAPLIQEIDDQLGGKAAASAEESFEEALEKWREEQMSGKKRKKSRRLRKKPAGTL
jgi:hypothetical protein